MVVQQRGYHKGWGKLFERFMDDGIRTINLNSEEAKLEQINGLYEGLKFAVEVGKEGQIQFLDMLLIRKGRKVESTWYCKPTESGLVMNVAP